VLRPSGNVGHACPTIGWAQWIGEGLPLTHYLRIVRAILLKGATFSELALDAWALAGLMLVAMTIAVTRFRRTLD
jgi:ABC-2 type transport system permease protein